MVIAIIAILIGLLIPAVQTVHDAAEDARQYASLQPAADAAILAVDGDDRSNPARPKIYGRQVTFSLWPSTAKPSRTRRPSRRFSRRFSRTRQNSKAALEALPKLGPASRVPRSRD